MRGRIGGIIGFAAQPTASSASRIWSLAEAYSAKRGAYYSGGDGWPSRAFTITWPEGADYADATQTGAATFAPEVRTATESRPYDYYWERSTDDGATWSAVSGSTGSGTTEFDYGPYSGYVGSAPLTVTGRTITNDEDLYRLVVTSGLKVFYSTPATLRFDSVTIDFVDQLEINLPGDLGFYAYPTSSATRTVAAGTDVEIVCGFLITGQKYAQTYSATSLQFETSTDGGATWTNGTGVADSNPDEGVVYFTAAAGDNGRKWRATIHFNATSATTRVITLTVT